MLISYCIDLHFGCFMHRLSKGDCVSYSTNRDLLSFERPPRISYDELLQETKGFDQSNFLGKGSFGSVYKGLLSSEQIVSAKIFILDLKETLRSFDTE